MARPLEGLRVIDVGTRIGAPFCAGLLAEWGADVVKVEQPRTGDFMRTIGPFVDGYSLFWAVEGRGRKSVTCDLRVPEGQDLFRRLASTADVVCENFRPGTMEDWGIGPGELDPRLVFVRISAFGQDGPYAGRPGLDRLGVAYGGLLHLTGEADRPPVRPGVTVADYLTGVFAAEAALAALYRRDAGRGADGKGAVVDASLYGSVLRILEWTIPAYDRLGTVRAREGNRLSNSAPLDNYPTADGNYVCVVAGGDANFARLCRAMGRVDLLEDPRFTTLGDRARNGDTINAIVAEWTSSQSATEVESACIAHDVPVATAYTARDIALDPHFAARHDLVAVDDPVLGPLRQQAPYPRLVGEGSPVPSGAPPLGEHNREVWCDVVGLSPSELEALQAKGIV
jgi:crotonobetainyl-CoA:carnitine CoA-transferase CaiB-like acyl-CoA transferase